jgi:nucleoside phosphorylase
VPKILVTFALRQEGVSFERRLTQRLAKSDSVLGRLHSQEVAVYRLGTGVRNEDQFKKALTDLHPGLVINSGFAGAIRTLLEPGDFVIAENFSSPELLKRLEVDGVFEARGRFACVDIVADPTTKMRFRSEGDLFAIDMESARVASVCREHSMPLITARMISDRYDEAIPGVFLGQGIEQMSDIFQAMAFASRMIVLRRRLADRLVALVRAINLEIEEKR